MFRAICVTAGVLFWHSRFLPTILPAQAFALLAPISTGLALFWTTKLPLIMLPQTAPCGWPAESDWICKSLPIEAPRRLKALLPEIVTLRSTVQARAKLPPVTLTSPLISQGLVNTQFCPAETVTLPLKTPL